MSLLSLTKEIAIDLGTANTIIITDGKIAVDPLHSVAKGTGIALKCLSQLKFLD